MILKSFIDEVCEEVGNYDKDMRENLLRKKISNIEGQIVNVTNLIQKQFSYTVTDSLKVRLPYDFRYANSIVRNGAYVYRVDAHELNGTATLASVDVNQQPVSDKQNLVLRPKDFEFMNIPVNRSMIPEGFGYNLYGNEYDSLGAFVAEHSIGYVFDNSGIYVPENIASELQMKIHLRVRDAGDDGSRYSDVKRTEDNDIIEILTIFGLYKIKINRTADVFYLAENGFAYDGEDLTTANLISRGNQENGNLILNMDSLTVGDVISVNYSASSQIYISEEQHDIVLDRFKYLVFLGTVAEAFSYLKKPMKAREWQEKYIAELKVTERESGKLKNFGKQKSFINIRTKYRLPQQR